MQIVANDVQRPGHPRRRPLRSPRRPLEQVLAALTEFLAPYRDESPAR